MVDFLKAGMSLMFESTNEKSYTKHRKTLYI